MIGCGQKKQDTEESVPAEDLYTPTYFQLKKRYAEAWYRTLGIRSGKTTVQRVGHPSPPERELLFAVKIHSGRKADPRNLVVLAAGADSDRIATHLHRGESKKLAGRIDTVLDRLTSEDFADAFKGVFEQQTVPDQDIDTVVEFLRDQQRRIDSKS